MGLLEGLGQEVPGCHQPGRIKKEHVVSEGVFRVAPLVMSGQELVTSRSSLLGRCQSPFYGGFL